MESDFQEQCWTHKLTSHCESTYKQPNVPPPNHDAFTSFSTVANARVLVLPGSPDPHKEDQGVEDDNGHEALDVDGHVLPSTRPDQSKQCTEG